jgi:hypothetical protein
MMVTREMNSDFLAPYSELEANNVLFKMFPTKAPGSRMAFHLTFFFKNIRTYVVIWLLNGDDSPKEINEKIIVLIPKVKKPIIPLSI